MDDKEAEHKELLVLYQDAARAREYYKKSTFSYLITFSVLVYVFVSKDCDYQSRILNISLLGVAAIFCAILVWSNNQNFKVNKYVSETLAAEFSDKFKRVRDPEGKEGADFVNKLIYSSAVTYPFIAWGWAYVSLFNFPDGAYIGLFGVILADIFIGSLLLNKKIRK